MSESGKLIQLLERHKPADATERSNIDQTLKFLAATNEPMNRNRFVPGHAVGSALISDPDHRHVMLVMHSKLKRWLQPGGHAEPGETDPLPVACREALEEVGCRLEAEAGKFCDIDVHVVPARKSEPEHLHYDFRYHFVTPVGETHPASDALEARWFTLEEAFSLDLDEGLRRMIGKLKR
jgi:8-oxo-dGTP pyrophosphatase MutT (NUDIX family)